jgi:hypothetical protein
MQRFNIERFEYLCIQTDGDGGYDCYGCNSKDEVFQVLTDRIHDELDWLEGRDSEDGTGDPDYTLFKDPSEASSFAMWIKSQDIIKNPDIIRKCYEYFFADCWGFYVIDADGALWFGWY